MKLFTVSEANALLPEIEPILRQIRDLYAQIDAAREAAALAASASTFGGGMPGGTAYVQAVYKVGNLVAEIHEVGVELKDYQRGLIDFPSMRGERLVLLCWQLGEKLEIEWWHEQDAGFAGRQPI